MAGPRAKPARLPESRPLAAPALILAFAAAAALQVLYAANLPFGQLNDDSLHVLLARSLGGGFFSLPDGFGRPATEPLPGFALLLALPAELIAPRWELLRWASLLASWAAVALTFRLARLLGAGGAARTAALLVALNPVFLTFSGAVLPDIPYTALSLALLAALPSGPARVPGKRLALLAAGAALAALLRPHGVLLILAMAVALWTGGARRAAVLFGLAALLPSGLWAARCHVLAGTASGYIQSWSLWAEGLSAPGGQLRHGARLVALLLGQGLLAISGGFPLLLAAGLAALGLSAWAAARLLRRGRDLRAFAVAVYAVGLGVLHLIWGTELSRYLLPVLPLAWALMAAGLEPGGASLWGLRKAVAVLALALCLRADLSLIPARPQWGKTLWPGAMAWIRKETPASARVQSPYFATVMLLTDRPAVAVFGGMANRDQWLALALSRGVDYVLLDENPAGWYAEPYGTRPLDALGAWCRSSRYVREAHREPAEGSILFEVRHPAPGRYLKAWEAYGSALRAWQGGASLEAVRRGLREAARLEPELAGPWAALARLETNPRARVRDLERASRADPESAFIKRALTEARSQARM